jgi:hypothetical protein
VCAPGRGGPVKDGGRILAKEISPLVVQEEVKLARSHGFLASLIISGSQPRQLCCERGAQFRSFIVRQPVRHLLEIKAVEPGSILIPGDRLCRLGFGENLVKVPSHFVRVGPPYGRWPVLVEVGFIVQEEVALTGRHGFPHMVSSDSDDTTPETAAPRDSSFDLSPHPTGELLAVFPLAPARTANLLLSESAGSFQHLMASFLPLAFAATDSCLCKERMCPVVCLDLLDLERLARQDLDHLAGARIDALARGRGASAIGAVDVREC